MVYSIANPSSLSHIEEFLNSKTIDKAKFKFVLLGYLHKEGERKIFTKEVNYRLFIDNRVKIIQILINLNFSLS
jgi:hypothetical protein